MRSYCTLLLLAWLATIYIIAPRPREAADKHQHVRKTCCDYTPWQVTDIIIRRLGALAGIVGSCAHHSAPPTRAKAVFERIITRVLFTALPSTVPAQRNRKPCVARDEAQRVINHLLRHMIHGGYDARRTQAGIVYPFGVPQLVPPQVYRHA